MLWLGRGFRFLRGRRVLRGRFMRIRLIRYRLSPMSGFGGNGFNRAFAENQRFYIGKAEHADRFWLGRGGQQCRIIRAVAILCRWLSLMPAIMGGFRGCRAMAVIGRCSLSVPATVRIA